MSEQELRSLDAWIAEHVMGFVKEPYPDETGWKDKAGKYLNRFNPTIDPTAAIEVLKKCCDRKTVAVVQAKDGGWQICLLMLVGMTGAMGWPTQAIETEADTLELAICLFAKQLFATDGPHATP
jgi:hypothetical protein